jgi:hypothetical protein
MKRTLLGLGLLICSAMTQAATSIPASTAYDTNPQHLWNQLNSALFARVAPEGKVYGLDDLDVLYWQDTEHLTQGPLSLTPNMSFVSHGIMDYLGVTPAQGALYTETIDGTLPPALAAYGFQPMPYNYVPSYFLFGLNATFSFDNVVSSLKGLRVFVQVNNPFNKTPPFTGGESEFGPANSYGGTNPMFFDVLGLDYRAGFRLTF